MKFRWTLTGESLDPNYVQGPLEIDYLNKKIKFSVVEVLENKNPVNAHVFQKSIVQWPASEMLTFTTYDGCGYPLYERTFDGIKALEVKQNFDYASSEISTIDFVLGFSSSNSNFPQNDISKNKLDTVNIKEKEKKIKI